MKKHTKIVLLSLVTVGVVLAGTVMFLSRPEPDNIGQLVPYLAHRKPSDESETLTSFAGGRAGTLSNKMHTKVFTIDEKFEVVRDALKKDLNSRTLNVTNYATKSMTFTIMSVGKPSAAGSFSLTIRKASDRTTTVGVIEHQSLNPVDRIKLWYAGVTSKKKGGIIVVSNAKPKR